MFLGALAQSIPDIDFVAALWLSPTDNLLVHRGFTHSFLFGVLATTVLAFLSSRWYREREISMIRWAMFWGAEILMHLLLDACNAYGVGWFEPFDHARFSFHILFVADPFYSLAPGVAMFVLITISSKSRWRRSWMYFGLIVSSSYFLYAVYNKIKTDRAFTSALEKTHIPYNRILTTPTPLNTWLWYTVAEVDSGYYTSYRSVFDESDRTFTFVRRGNEHLAPLYDRKDVQQLLRFSQGYYTVEQCADTLVFNDLRFGQMAGWDDPKAGFVFHYYLNYPDANLLVIQRGRFSNWNRKTFRSMIRRIRGD
jgi:inner membrane protein